jgi:rod shape-determining protein MreD
MQATSFDYIKLAGIRPDLLIVFTVFIALSYSRKDTMKAAITAGLIKDITSSAILGSSVFSFLALGFFINFHQNKFYAQRLSTQIGLCFLSCIFAGVVVLACNAAAYRQLYVFYESINLIIRGAVYTSVIAPFIFLILSRILRVNFEHV